MRNELPTNSCSPTSRSSVAITRASLFKFVGLLVGVFLLACYALVYVAQNLDRAEEIDNAFYTKKAVYAARWVGAALVRDDSRFAARFGHDRHAPLAHPARSQRFDRAAPTDPYQRIRAAPGLASPPRERWAAEACRKIDHRTTGIAPRLLFDGEYPVALAQSQVVRRQLVV
jgi:hypothetical protein